MKQKLFLAYMTLLLSGVQNNVATAQTTATIYTKGGQAIEVLIYDQEPLSEDRIAQINKYYTSTYPNATLLSDASARYNCHSYAWNMSDGGDTCWINEYNNDKNPNIAKYWTNDYYSETTEANAVKIYYYNGDHSAVASKSVSGMYESKWGQAPLMRHAPGYGPYTDMDKRKYYYHPDSSSSSSTTTPSVYDGLIQCSIGDGPVQVGVAADYRAVGESIGMVYVIETAKGDDAIEAGYAVVNKVLYDGINVTFTRKGLYEMYLYFYNSDNQLCARYWYEPAVEE